MCHSPSGPDLLICSGVVAFWRIRIVQRWRGQQLRMRLWLVFTVHQEHLLICDLLGRRQVSKICVSRSSSIGVLHIAFKKLPKLLPGDLG